MDQIKRITVEQLRFLADQKGFPEFLLAKDYYLTVLLYLLRNMHGLYFKGGTALNKIFLNYARLSEDIDFTLDKDVHLIKKEIGKIITENKLFQGITEDKRVDKFVRLMVHYTDPFMNKGTIFIDLNQKGTLTLPPAKQNIPHFYPENIPLFSVTTLHPTELFAEKMRAAIERNKPRDHFDLYQIVKLGLPLDFKLVQKKCAEAGCSADITKMFNSAKTLKNRWDRDVEALLAKKISFQEVMTTLAKHFHLKEEKKKKQDTPSFVKIDHKTEISP